MKIEDRLLEIGTVCLNFGGKLAGTYKGMSYHRGIIFMTILITLIGRTILKPIQSTTLMLQDVAEVEGDLTKRLAVSNDELGELAGSTSS